MQVKKKAAKKTYKSSAKKKTVPSLNKVTMDELKAIVAEASKTMAENHAKTEAAIQELSAENRKLSADLAKGHAKTEAAIDRLTAQNDRTADEIRKLSAENRKTSDEVRKTAALVHELTRNIGGLNNSYGTLVEIVLIPKIRHDINAIGKHTFNRVLVDKKVSALVAGEKNTIGEIDLFLFSDADAEATVVEIKAQFNINQVKDRLERLQKFRDYEEDAEIKGKKLFGAIAGIYIDPRAKAFALENGLYVIEIHEEVEKIDITKPETCRKW